MIQLGIRLHDVNAGLSPEYRTMEARADRAREEGFSCVHLAFSKVISGVSFDEAALNPGLALHTRRVFASRGLDVAVLGCYLNLAHPDPLELAKIQGRYFGHVRAASLLGASVVGTETGCPNAAYKTDEFTHGEGALDTFIRGLAPVVETAERFGICVAIEPVWKHIVYNAERAERVIDVLRSKNLRIIFDPVNLLCPENLDRREAIFGEMIDRLADRIDVVHIKDYVPANGDLKSVAACTGEMDYTTILRFIKQRKPYLQATLENTTNDNAVWSREQIQNLYDSL